MENKTKCGLSHLGKHSCKQLWVTVQRFSDCARLLKWFPGCQFSPNESWHPTVETAKKAGEIAMEEERWQY